MGLPFKPETVDKLAERFDKALDSVVNVEQLGKMRPGMNRKHVFDFEDGLRMIVSVDDFQQIRYLHLSGSLHKEQPKPINNMDLLQMMVAKMLLLNGKSFSGVGNTTLSKGGVVHLVIPLNPEHITIGETP
jgi:hypothetical protein